jgi:hypothetical protein
MILCDLLVTDIPPRKERFVSGGKAVSHIKPRPDSADIVVREVAVLLQLGERINNGFQFRFDLGRWTGLGLERRLDHFSVFKHASKAGSLIAPFPIENEVSYEQVE